MKKSITKKKINKPKKINLVETKKDKITLDKLLPNTQEKESTKNIEGKHIHDL